MKNSTVERFLYLILLLTFILLSILCIALAQSTHRLSVRVGYFQNQIQANHELAKAINYSTDTIICMLKVPVADRTENVEQNCRREAGAPPEPSPNPAVSKTPDKNKSPQQTPTKSTSAVPGANSGGGPGLGNQQPSILPLISLRVCPLGSIVLNGVCLSN